MGLHVIYDRISLGSGDHPATSLYTVTCPGCGEKKRDTEQTETGTNISDKVRTNHRQCTAWNPDRTQYPRQHNVPEWIQVHEMQDVSPDQNYRNEKTRKSCGNEHIVTSLR